MKRVAFLVGPALGHFSRMHVVAKRLSELADVEIHVFAPDRLRFDPDDFAGIFPVTKVPISPDAHPFARDPKHDATTYVDYAAGLEPALDAYRPDVIVHDCNPMQWLSTMRFPECPRINATDVFLTKLAKSPTVQVEHFRLSSEHINGEREAKGLAPLENPFQIYEADKVLLLDPLQMIALFEPLPEHYRASGACSWSYPGPVPAELENERDLLLCSMGSTGRDVEPEVIRAIKRKTGCRKSVFVSSETEIDGPTTDPADPHDFRYAKLPLGRIYSQVKAVMSQGGAGSTYQALSHGKPIIAAPAHDNHVICGTLLASLGVGICMKKGGDLASVEEFDYNPMANAAEAFGEEMRANDSATRIATEIAEFC